MLGRLIPHIGLSSVITFYNKDYNVRFFRSNSSLVYVYFYSTFLTEVCLAKTKMFCAIFIAESRKNLVYFAKKLSPQYEHMQI